MNRVSQLGAENRSAWKDLLGRLTQSKKADTAGEYLRVGVEGALNYMNISANNNSTFGGANAIDVYQFPIAIPQPPYADNGLPGQSALQLPGMNPPNAVFFTQDHLDANLWGFRLGPYVEYPFGDKKQFTLSLSGGLAVGLLDATESWNQTVTFGNNVITSSGGGSSFDALWGFYIGANGNYQFSDHWVIRRQRAISGPRQIRPRLSGARGST